MRVAYVTADPGVPVYGKKGCSIHVREVLRAMLKRGIQIDLFASNLSGIAPADLANLTVHPLPTPPKGDLAFREQQCLRANEPLREMLETNGPFDLVYERYSLWSYAAMGHAAQTSTPGLLEVNAPLIEEQAEHRGLIDLSSAQQVARRAFDAATALVAVSDEVAAYLNRFEQTRGKVAVVPNGVNPDNFTASIDSSCARLSEKFTVGFVGSMKPWHGVKNLVEAFTVFNKRFSETRLLLVGDGPGRAELASEVTLRNLDHAVQFTGAVASEEVPRLLQSMDVAVAPYPKLTNFYFSPLKVYEYMAAGLPVIASKVGQIEQIVEQNVTGLLVPPGDISALAEAFERVQSEAGLGKRLGKAARERVVRCHTWDAALDRILLLARINSVADNCSV